MLTQEELAEKSDISRVMVSRYENGMATPTIDVLISLADALNVSIDYLLGRAAQEHALFQPPCADIPAPLQDALPESVEELRQFVLSILREHHLLN